MGIGMNKINKDFEPLKKLDIEKFAIYLENHGWRKETHKNKNILLFEGPNDDAGDPLELLLPANLNLKDSLLRLSEAINTLSIVNNELPDLIIQEILRTQIKRKELSIQAKALFDKGFSLYHQGKTGTAKKYFKQAIELDTQFLDILNNSLMNSLGSIGEWNRVITGMRVILEIKPDYEIARTNLAIAYMKAGDVKVNGNDIERAAEYYITALSIKPPEEIEKRCKNNLAHVYTKAGIEEFRLSNSTNDFMQIETHLSKSLAYMFRACGWKSDEVTRRNLGLAHACLGEFYFPMQPEAVIYYLKQAEDVGLVSPELINDYGLALVLTNDLDEAIWAFERALDLSPQNEEIRFNLGITKKIQSKIENSKSYSIQSTEEMKSLNKSLGSSPKKLQNLFWDLNHVEPPNYCLAQTA